MTNKQGAGWRLPLARIKGVENETLLGGIV